MLYLNGTYLGQGPARSRLFEQSYDTYEVGNLLVAGSPGMEPWTSLVARDIPLLSQELMYPQRVLEVNERTPETS